MLGETVKVPYTDRGQLKIVKGTLVDVKDNSVIIQGRLGTINIKNKNIGQISRAM